MVPTIIQGLGKPANFHARTPCPDPILDLLSLFIRLWPVYDLTSMIVFEAGRGVRDHQFSYYDAQIWATARLNQVPIIFSEDFGVGSTIEGVRFINPFSPDFVIETWIQ